MSFRTGRFDEKRKDNAETQRALRGRREEYPKSGPGKPGPYKGKQTERHRLKPVLHE
jgi:hypothetical protein